MSPACIWASTWPGESVGEDVGDVGEVAELEAREVEGEELLLCELACVDRVEEVNTQQLTQLLQIYNTLASNNLAPPSQSATKLSTLVQTSGIMPALPAVLGQYYPGRVYSNYV